MVDQDKVEGLIRQTKVVNVIQVQTVEHSHYLFPFQQHQPAPGLKLVASQARRQTSRS